MKTTYFNGVCKNTQSKIIVVFLFFVLLCSPKGVFGTEKNLYGGLDKSYKTTGFKTDIFEEVAASLAAESREYGVLIDDVDYRYSTTSKIAKSAATGTANGLEGAYGSILRFIENHYFEEIYLLD